MAAEAAIRESKSTEMEMFVVVSESRNTEGPRELKKRQSRVKGAKLAVGVRNLPALSFFPDVFQQEPNNICSKGLLSTARIED